MIDRITEYLLYVMLLSPLLSYLTTEVFDLFTILHVYVFLVNILGIIFIFANWNKKIKVPHFLYFMILWSIYLIVWTFYNGSIEDDGIIALLRRGREIAIIFFLLIIYNTNFRNKFITNSILIFKFTVLSSFLFTLIQVINPAFFNAWDYWTSDSNISNINDNDIYQIRRTSIFGFIDLNAVGLTFVPILSLLIGYLIYNNSYFLTYLMMGGIVAVLSNTRYVMVAFLIITLQYLLYNTQLIKSLLKYMIMIFFLLFFIIISISSLDYDISSYFQQRLFAEGALTETTRFIALINFAEFFPLNPLIGNGDIYNEDVVYASRLYGSSHIHVGYLSHLVAYGLIGCFFLYSFWFTVMHRFFKTAKATGYWGSFFGFLVFLWAFATFSQSSIFYTGIIYTFVFDKYFNDNYVK